jgi:hypothetical protein
MKGKIHNIQTLNLLSEKHSEKNYLINFTTLGSKGNIGEMTGYS